jgi:hypothetical protein
VSGCTWEGYVLQHPGCVKITLLPSHLTSNPCRPLWFSTQPTLGTCLQPVLYHNLLVCMCMLLQWHVLVCFPVPCTLTSLVCRLLEAITPDSEDLAISNYKLATFYYVNVCAFWKLPVSLLQLKAMVADPKARYHVEHPAVLLPQQVFLTRSHMTCTSYWTCAAAMSSVDTGTCTLHKG